MKTREKLAWTVALIGASASPGCEPAQSPADTAPPVTRASPTDAAPWLREGARGRGLVFDHDSGERGDLLFPAISCGGAALFDMDGDGDLDAYLVQAGVLGDPPDRRPPNRLFRNRGDGTFDDVTAGSHADDRGIGMGVATGDYDGDGDEDLYVTNVGANVLLRNDGVADGPLDGQPIFTDVTASSGTGDTGWGSSAVFVDYDADGDLDLYVVNYIHWTPASERDCYATTGVRDYCAPSVYAAPAEDTLYRNDGHGVFTDVSAAVGIRAAFGNGLGVVAGDFDGNGHLDIYVANDGTRNQMWLNRGDGTFEDAALAMGTALDLEGTPKAGMGVDVTDVDDDGDLDLLVVNLVNENDSFYRNEGGYFIDDTAAVGLATVSRRHTRFGVGLHDLDNDGRLDLYEANGRVRREPRRYSDDPFAEPNHLFRGGASGRFTEVLPAGGTDEPLIATSRAAAFGDVDGDGGMDVLVVNRDGPAHLLLNVVPDRGHWLSIEVRERAGGFALGALVALELDARTIHRPVQSAASYCAANDPRVHVGLGSVTLVPHVDVRWLDGVVERFDIGGVDRTVVLRRGAGARAVNTSD